VIVALDTNVLIDLLRGRHPHMRAHVDGALAAGDEVVASSVVLYELIRGALRSGRPERHLAEIDAILTRLRIIPLDRADAVAAAHLQVALERTGRGIGVFDRLIAGQALARGWTLVTGNLSEFARVEGLRLLQWSEAGDAISLIGHAPEA